ncbi:YceI family protein [Spongiimicrobium salis]|uniref:YceI family protein n=1 Tax=Spongiimicrobium salis TaxID=1667022 RepID=UPI00374DCE1C
MKLKGIFIPVLLFFSSILSAQNYAIDSGHSTVQIQVDRFGVVDVVGRFKAISGTIAYDADAPDKTMANAIIQVDSYDANNAGGEAAVKSKAFLDAATYPEIRFSAKETMVKDGKQYFRGDLTIHGITKEVQLPFSIKGPLLDLPTKKQSIAFTSSITINRQDFGIRFNAKLPSGTSIVGDEVKITLIILALAE